MQFSILSLLMVASTASAAVVPYLPRSDAHLFYPRSKGFYPRQAASLNSTISTINANNQALADGVKAYQGGFLAGASLASKESTLETSLTTATAQVKAMAPLSPADSKALMASANTMMPHIKASLDALMSRQKEISEAGFNSVVAGDITKLKGQTDELANAMMKIADPSVQPQAMATVQQIDAMFAPALKMFGASA